MDDRSYTQAFLKNFLGTSPDWYKITIITFLILNPILFFITPFWAGWLLVVEFIFTLGMALKCYPLQPGGLLAIEAIISNFVINVYGSRHLLHEAIIALCLHQVIAQYSLKTGLIIGILL